MVAALECLDGPLAGELITLESDCFLIGRETECDLRPDSELISRHHCVLRRDEYGLRVRDLGSRNGTFVNGEKIRGDVVLSDGDELRVGDMTFHIVLDRTAESGGATLKSPDEAHQQTALLEGNTLPPSGSKLSVDSSADKMPAPTPSLTEEKMDRPSQ